MIPFELRRWMAFGSGIGIQIAGAHGSETLHIAAARVRPGGARVLGRLTVEDFPHQLNLFRRDLLHPLAEPQLRCSVYLQNVDFGQLAASPIVSGHGEAHLSLMGALKDPQGELEIGFRDVSLADQPA